MGDKIIQTKKKGNENSDKEKDRKRDGNNSNH